MDIGPKIKQLRIKNALTLEELASRCELTKGFLSQVERDLTSPSVSTLNDILEALGTSLSDFFQETKEEKLVFIDERAGTTVHWIVPNAQKNEMEPILLDIDPEGESQIIDPHDGEEFGYVLQGRIYLVYNEEELLVKKGETFYISGKHTHFIKNAGKSTATVLWITTPPTF